MLSTKMDPSYKVDEGYSEDTRSQDDPDSPMRMEPDGDDILPTQIDAVMALSEGDKSGKQCQLFLNMLRHIAGHANMHRTRVQHPSYP